MSFLVLDTKGNLARNYGTVASQNYGYKAAVIDLRSHPLGRVQPPHPHQPLHGYLLGAALQSGGECQGGEVCKNLGKNDHKPGWR